MLRQLECIISGRVQGVLFRDFICRKARRLGLVGIVENMPDGAVRVVALGSQHNLDRLIVYLKRGSMFSRVEAVEEKWGNAEQMFSDFKIVYKNLSDRL